MSLPSDFFAEFPSVSKAQWLERIAKDLKGKPLDDLYWHLNETVTVDPFGHADDQPVPPAPLCTKALPWEINEDIAPSTPADANRQALEALAFGAESVQFSLAEADVPGQLEALLHRIYLDYIGVHFGGEGVAAGPAALLAALGSIAQEQGISTKNLRGSLSYDPAAARLPDWRYLAELLQYAQAHFPGFRCITVNGTSEHRGATGATDELAAVLQRGAQYIEQGAAHGLDLAQMAAQIQFSLSVGKSYFVEIAKLRAFKLLWLHVLKTWNIPLEYPVLDVRFAPDAYTDDLYTNMIRATTMAMSAVLGGADRLTVLPYDAGREEQAQYPRAFGRRIARNVQHLLKLESGFGAMPDPAAGSFYVEKLTAQLAETAWKKALQRGL
jgi:methylmalonyl-CoA mutase